MAEILPCPYGDAELASMGLLLQHVARHLAEDVPPDSPAAKLMATWESSAAARSSSGRSQEILPRLLAASLANRGVIETGAVQVTETAHAAGEAAAQLAELAVTYGEQLAESVEDRKTLRQEAAALKAEVAQVKARIAALEPHGPPGTPPTGATT